jgi:hypothetical protein
MRRITMLAGWFVWKGLRVEKSQRALQPKIRAWVELSNHGQEPWKAPLPQFIEHLYRKRFGREQPRVVTPAENWERPAAARNPARNAPATNARGDQAGPGSRRDHA